MSDSILHKELLNDRGKNGEGTRCSECRGAIATELRGIRHLLADAADVAERSGEVIHGNSLYNAKYIGRRMLVNRRQRLSERALCGDG